MSTLIINGSPRRDGDTAALIDAFTSALAGGFHVVDCYDANIRPCVDCRACQAAFSCRVQDDMQPLYGRILEASGIVIASPIFFSELTGPLLSVLSRIQPGYYACRRGEVGFHSKPRRGGLLLAGGGCGEPGPAIDMGRRLLRGMGCLEIAPPVMCLNTDRLPARLDSGALDAARALAGFFNAARPE